MKIDKILYLHYNAYSKNYPPIPWPLDLPRHIHAKGFPLRDNMWGHNQADYWAIEADEIVDAYKSGDAFRNLDGPTYWSDIDLGRYAFASAWEQE